jgi:hypothetical protein
MSGTTSLKLWMAAMVVAIVGLFLAVILAVTAHASGPVPHPGHSAPLIAPVVSPTPAVAPPSGVLAIRVPDTGGASR